MSLTKRAATKEAFEAVPETCPIVDDAARVLVREIEDRLVPACVDVIKDCTRRLRDALIDAIEARLDAEARLDERDREIRSLNDQIVELEAELEREREQ